MDKVRVGLDYRCNVVIVGDIIKARFKLDNPWKVIEIYRVDIDNYNYHIAKGNKDIWLCDKDIEFLSCVDDPCILAN